ncbi:MAG: hypothetical protein KatS3mg050_4899 [Litorilinea sp.]|nr:MAG: hypothetical protein KatS3mg050_4899 [Litorilinea sp.]
MRSAFETHSPPLLLFHQIRLLSQVGTVACFQLNSRKRPEQLASFARSPRTPFRKCYSVLKDQRCRFVDCYRDISASSFDLCAVEPHTIFADPIHRFYSHPRRAGDSPYISVASSLSGWRPLAQVRSPAARWCPEGHPFPLSPHPEPCRAWSQGMALTSSWRRARVPIRSMRMMRRQAGSGQTTRLSVSIQSAG